ncbi:ComEA family DNA-binding protein [Bacillus sp. SB49]|uniref:helix-hairpin-helix domain-containing protein n=1 Tax=Bacillus sp. SB49 TaxID=1071080 RepID=UPI000403288A|nr:helix-hairpin-helix domain-containing protein [Bacillus sp. SB49]QHT47221.1 ComEA family DNA-binding protein [Bacillus sp. SB49]
MTKWKRYLWLGAPLLIILLLYWRESMSPTPAAVEKVEAKHEEEAEAKQEETATFRVDVKGEVSKPGVYVVRPGMRVDDVIREAGGMTEFADPLQVNLAQILQDEMVVLVPSAAEEAAVPGPSASAVGEKLAVNQATAAEMETLPGIGPSKAEAIIQYREENGPFASVDDLVNVPGIGEKTLENMRDSIRAP